MVLRFCFMIINNALLKKIKKEEMHIQREYFEMGNDDCT